MISQLTQVEVERDEGGAAGLTDVEIVGFLALLGGAGAETVTKAIGNAVVNFANNPDQWRMLREDRSMIPSAFEEVLRYEGPSQYNIRYSMREVTLHGRTIPKHSPVMLINGSATRDERMFPDPDRFDITRNRPGTISASDTACTVAWVLPWPGWRATSHWTSSPTGCPSSTSQRSDLRRVNMTNVMGYSHVPVHVTK